MRGVWLVVLVLGVGGLFLLPWGRWLAIREIIVEGGERITADDVRRAMGIEVGDNLFRADLRAAQARLLRLPWVKRAVLRRLWLPPRLEVRLQERTPLVAVRLPDGERFWMDAEGYLLEPVAASAEGTLTAEGLPPPVETEIPQGERIADEHVLEVLRELAGRGDLLASFVQVRFRPYSVELLTPAGEAVRLPWKGFQEGPPAAVAGYGYRYREDNPFRRALARLGAIWPRLWERVSFRYADLRFPGELVIMPR